MDGYQSTLRPSVKPSDHATPPLPASGRGRDTLLALRQLQESLQLDIGDRFRPAGAMVNDPPSHPAAVTQAVLPASSSTADPPLPLSSAQRDPANALSLHARIALLEDQLQKEVTKNKTIYTNYEEQIRKMESLYRNELVSHAQTQRSLSKLETDHATVTTRMQSVADKLRLEIEATKTSVLRLGSSLNDWRNASESLETKMTAARERLCTVEIEWSETLYASRAMVRQLHSLEALAERQGRLGNTESTNRELEEIRSLLTTTLSSYQDVNDQVAEDKLLLHHEIRALKHKIAMNDGFPTQRLRHSSANRSEELVLAQLEVGQRNHEIASLQRLLRRHEEEAEMFLRRELFLRWRARCLEVKMSEYNAAGASDKVALHRQLKDYRDRVAALSATVRKLEKKRPYVAPPTTFLKKGSGRLVSGPAVDEAELRGQVAALQDSLRWAIVTHWKDRLHNNRNRQHYHAALIEAQAALVIMEKDKETILCSLQESVGKIEKDRVLHEQALSRSCHDAAELTLKQRELKKDLFSTKATAQEIVMTEETQKNMLYREIRRLESVVLEVERERATAVNEAIDLKRRNEYLENELATAQDDIKMRVAMETYSAEVNKEEERRVERGKVVEVERQSAMLLATIDSLQQELDAKHCQVVELEAVISDVNASILRRQRDHDDMGILTDSIVEKQGDLMVCLRRFCAERDTLLREMDVMSSDVAAMEIDKSDMACQLSDAMAEMQRVRAARDSFMTLLHAFSNSGFDNPAMAGKLRARNEALVVDNECRRQWEGTVRIAMATTLNALSKLSVDTAQHVASREPVFRGDVVSALASIVGWVSVVDTLRNDNRELSRQVIDAALQVTERTRETDIIQDNAQKLLALCHALEAKCEHLVLQHSVTLDALTDKLKSAEASGVSTAKHLASVDAEVARLRSLAQHSVALLANNDVLCQTLAGTTHKLHTLQRENATLLAAIGTMDAQSMAHLLLTNSLRHPSTFDHSARHLYSNSDPSSMSMTSVAHAPRLEALEGCGVEGARRQIDALTARNTELSEALSELMAESKVFRQQREQSVTMAATLLALQQLTAHVSTSLLSFATTTQLHMTLPTVQSLDTVTFVTADDVVAYRACVSPWMHTIFARLSAKVQHLEDLVAAHSRDAQRLKVELDAIKTGAESRSVVLAQCFDASAESQKLKIELGVAMTTIHTMRLEREQWQARVQDVEASRRHAETAMAGVSAKRSELSSRVDDLERQLGQRKAQYDALEDERTEKARELEACKLQIQEVTVTLAETRALWSNDRQAWQSDRCALEAALDTATRQVEGQATVATHLAADLRQQLCESSAAAQGLADEVVRRDATLAALHKQLMDAENSFRMEISELNTSHHQALSAVSARHAALCQSYDELQRESRGAISERDQHLALAQVQERVLQQDLEVCSSLCGKYLDQIRTLEGELERYRSHDAQHCVSDLVRDASMQRLHTDATSSSVMLSSITQHVATLEASVAAETSARESAEVALDDKRQALRRAEEENEILRRSLGPSQRSDSAKTVETVVVATPGAAVVPSVAASAQGLAAPLPSACQPRKQRRHSQYSASRVKQEVQEVTANVQVIERELECSKGRVRDLESMLSSMESAVGRREVVAARDKECGTVLRLEAHLADLVRKHAKWSSLLLATN